MRKTELEIGLHRPQSELSKTSSDCASLQIMFKAVCFSLALRCSHNSRIYAIFASSMFSGYRREFYNFVLKICLSEPSINCCFVCVDLYLWLYKPTLLLRDLMWCRCTGAKWWNAETMLFFLTPKSKYNAFIICNHRNSDLAAKVTLFVAFQPRFSQFWPLKIYTLDCVYIIDLIIMRLWTSCNPGRV